MLLQARILMARGENAEALGLLDRGMVQVEAGISIVDEALCRGCGMCVASCPYSAIELTDEGVAKVNEAVCKACGVCSVTCLGGAAVLELYDDEQILANIEGLLQ